ncbi:conserved protein of unknown function [Rhodovastum atsumiense]|uniref:Uncharacterized protein n=1 Tax=Rhodovastum atsumiense TaxID=504468 RepID=A0A5M6IYT5_9PROT|nr:hypothetical protein [Rhodovastum atsumiense]KAA5613492.1 hypothetical protein F1189_05400 [Rhodovastum atsumiense]CAH2603236.1 conserved protein of unknown function [Rhodovastum atsumiense]
MDITTVVTAVLGLVPAEYGVPMLTLCGASAIIAALWPRPADGSRWLPLYQLVNALGANILHARNAPNTAMPTTPASTAGAPAGRP